MKCYYCNENEVNSQEHIIPNFTGSTLKSKLLCTNCNNTLGEKYDSKLSAAYKFFRSFLYNQQSSQKQAHFTVDESTKFFINKRGNKNTLYKVDDKWLNKDNLVQYCKAKNYQVNFTKNNNFTTDCYSSEEDAIQLGGKEYWYSVIKIAINFYLYNNLDSCLIDDILKEFRTENIVLSKNLMNTKQLSKIPTSKL